jgi:hypothetical protein
MPPIKSSRDKLTRSPEWYGNQLLPLVLVSEITMLWHGIAKSEAMLQENTKPTLRKTASKMESTLAMPRWHSKLTTRREPDIRILSHLSTGLLLPKPFKIT